MKENNWNWIILVVIIATILSPLLPSGNENFLLGILWRGLVISVIIFLIFCTGFGIYNLLI